MMRQHRRGAEAIEFVFLVPVMLIMAGGIIDFGWYASRQGEIQQAAIAGARAGARVKYDGSADVYAEAQAQAEATLAAAGITGANVATDIINLSNGEAALQVDVTADYEGLWGYVEIGAEYAGSATYRLDYQPLNPSPGF